MRTTALALSPRATRHGAILLTATLGLGASACGMAPADSAAPAGPSAAQSGDALALPAGQSTLGAIGFRDGALAADGTPLYLAGHVASTTVSDGSDARRFVLGALGRAYRLAAGSDLVVGSDSRDPEGRRYLRLRQVHDGALVFGAEVVVQVADGAVRSIHGKLAPDLHVAARRLDAPTALARALSGLARTADAARVHTAPEPAVWVDDQGQGAAAYRAVVEYVGVDGMALDELLISAADGTVLARLPRIHEALGRTVYTVNNGCVGLTGQLPGMMLGNDATPPTETAAKQVFDALGDTYYYYYYFLNRDSIDDQGFPLAASVHAKFFTGASCSPNNAAWLGDPYFQMAYGDGDGQQLKNVTAGFDVTAHEVTHGVTAKTSNLTYRNESGALNEAMSDIMGATAEAWRTSGGGSAGGPAMVTASANTWLIGEEVAGPALPWTGGALRFMDNPTKDTQSKDYYAERYTGSQDNGGVHLNSGIGNLAFYLASQGGKHPRGKTSTVVKSAGIATAAKIFARANMYLFTAGTTFQMARFATAQAAEDLYGRCSREWTTIHTAWDAVGVQGKWARCPSAPIGF